MKTLTKYRKQRLLFVMTLPPPIHGSAVMSQYIKDSKVINGTFECDYLNLSTSRSMDEIGKNSPIKVIRLLLTLFKELWLLSTRHYSLCYFAITCHGKGFLKDVSFVLLCKLFGKKIVIHQHNKGMAKDVEKWPYYWLLPLCYKKTIVILLSWRLYHDIERVVPKDYVFVCPNGIPVRDYNYKVKNHPTPHILFLSNLMPSKGVFVLLDALAILKRENFSFVCDIVGSETKEISTWRLSEEVNIRGLKGVVKYHGSKYGEEKNKLFENADIFAHPTLDDTFGLVILEAMQFGLPVVTTNEGGIPDIVRDGENGLICEKNSPTSLAKSIEVLLKDKKLCDSCGRKGRVIFESKYSLQSFEERVKDILDSCINE